MSDRSRLGDLIVMHGPYEAYAIVPMEVQRFVESEQLNALRDELMAARKMQVDLCRFRDEWTTFGDSTWCWLNRILEGYENPHEPWTEEADLARWLGEDDA